ncbi:hypothetical protein G3M48_006240 [Beauveria asiatica]|uniref:F-box domain-containing protein n=1 Tax=Beauveria asiatica TaxID=1069075 RepID=A0AAW0RQE4_9HYPO
MSSDDEDEIHIRIHSRCSACGFCFEPGDAVCACEPPLPTILSRYDVLIDDARAAVAARAFGQTRFPDLAYCDNKHGYDWSFCRFPACRLCRASPASLTVHALCLRLFRSCPPDDEGRRPCLREFLFAAESARPWRGAPPLALEPLVEYREAALVARRPNLLRLPPELRLLIWRFADGSPLWSSSAIYNINSALSACHSEPLVIRLADVNCWVRGAAAECGHVPARGLVRLTFDCRGLRRVERLKARPAVTGARSDFLAFVIEPAKAIADVHVTFQLGLAQLQLPSAKNFHIWDTPCPPPPHRCLSNWLPRPRVPSHIGTICLQDCTGVTLFVLSGSIYAVHAHTVDAPSAQATFNTLSSRLRKYASWVYVPVKGRITELGFSQVSGQVPERSNEIFQTQSFWLLVRQPTSGVLVGNYLVGSHKSALYTSQQPLLMFYDKPSDDIPISLVGAYSTTAISHSRHDPISIGAPRWVEDWSSATLAGVLTLWIYYVPGTEACRGLVMEYDDGQFAFLGQCRVGVDSTVQVTNPKYLCFNNEAYRTPYMITLDLL